MQKFLLIGLAIFITPSFAQLTQTKANKLDSFFNYLHTNKLAMGSVIITQKDSTVYQKTIGYLKYSLARNEQANENTMYRIGSISKTVTAVLILQLVDKGILKLSDSLVTYFPNFSKKITIKHLLNHRSGIFNFTDDPKYLTYMEQKMSRESLLKIIEKPKLDFEPGLKFSYSNSNYVLLSFILEDMYKMPFSAIVEQQISKPLNLTHFKVGDSIRTKNNQCYSYAFSNNTWEKGTETHMSVPIGAGNIISNPKDLSTFLNALMYKNFISTQSLSQMLQMEEGYGLGLMQFNFVDKGLGHTGGIDNFISQAIFLPKDSVCIIALTNGQNNYTSTIVNNLFAAARNTDFDLPVNKTITLNKEELSKYIGKYRNNDLKMNIKVFIKNNQLHAQATYQKAFTLQAVEKDIFAFNQAGIIMIYNEKNKEFKIRQAGKTYIFKDFKIAKAEEKARKKVLQN